MKLISFILIFIVFALNSRGNVNELSNKYDQFMIKCHGDGVEVKLAPLKIENLNKIVANYIYNLALIEDEEKKKEGLIVEGFPNLGGEVMVVISMRNKISKKYISIYIGLDKKLDIVNSKLNADNNIKNEFKDFIKTIIPKK